MSLRLDDTIAAIASAPGASLRGIIRISGHNVDEVIQQLLGRTFRSHSGASPTARAHPVSIPLGDGLSLPVRLHFWPDHRSFTGEPLAEIHGIGSPPLLEEILQQICLNGARPADRGEFTLRAFLAGKLDLVQAEAVLGVIDAADSEELTTALEQLGGGISSKIGAAREQLLLHLADLEAGLDFVEEDIDFVSRPELLQRLVDAEGWVKLLLTQAIDRIQSTGRRRVVLAGLPNAGKSTLFNHLAGAESALVSPIPGTTRDYLTTVLEHQGIIFELVDTAGWETARDGIEEAAAHLRQDQLERADLILWCSAIDRTEEETELDDRLFADCRSLKSGLIRITTKLDLVKSLSKPVTPDMGRRIAVSVDQLDGIDHLKQEISEHLTDLRKGQEMIGTTAARCEESLQHAMQGLMRARQLVNDAEGDELIALELRDVLGHLGRIVGEVQDDDILDRIFSRFCIGK